MKGIITIVLITYSSLLFSQVTEKRSTSYKFNEILNYIEMMYVDEVASDELTDAAIVAMLEKLDPHSSYITKEEVHDANERINGSFVGIGIRFQILKDSPAYKSNDRGCQFGEEF